MHNVEAVEVFDGAGQVVQHTTGVPLRVSVGRCDGIEKISSLWTNMTGRGGGVRVSVVVPLSVLSALKGSLELVFFFLILLSLISYPLIHPLPVLPDPTNSLFLLLSLPHESPISHLPFILFPRRTK